MSKRIRKWRGFIFDFLHLRRLILPPKMVIDNVLDRYRLPRTVEEDSDRSSGAVVDNFHNRYRQPRNVEEDSDRSRGAEIIPQIRMMDYDSLPLLCPLLHSLTRAFETISIHIIFDSIGYFGRWPSPWSTIIVDDRRFLILVFSTPAVRWESFYVALKVQIRM